MTVIALLPLLVAVVGVLVYALASSPKMAEIGRLAFAAGLLAFLLLSGGSLVAIRIH